jgi:hypothetical protein
MGKIISPLQLTFEGIKSRIMEWVGHVKRKKKTSIWNNYLGTQNVICEDNIKIGVLVVGYKNMNSTQLAQDEVQKPAFVCCRIKA